jgi:5,10-methylenetetrahydromethanopterin reductase
VEIGILMVPQARRTADSARMAEQLGFDTVLFPDSQNLAPEVWGQLMLAAKSTTRIRLAPGVSNSVTRDAAVTASAAAALQAESDGRALLGIGRGDSAVQRIGKREDPLASFETYLTMLQAYLCGESVDRDGFSSRLEWLDHAPAAKVPVVVAATGPRVIAAAARRADAVCFAAGCDPSYVATKLAHAREALRAAGRAPGAVRFGAFATCVLHDDVRVARDAVRGAAATFARFSAFRGADLSRLPEPLAAAARHLREHYDMREHTRAGAAHAAALSDEFLDWFAVAGSAAHATTRLRTLAAIGLDFLWIVPGSTGMPRDVAAGSIASLSRDVIPALKA